MLINKHLVVLIRDCLGNRVRLTSSFPSSDLGNITSLNCFYLTVRHWYHDIICCSSYSILVNALYPILIYTIPYYPKNIHFTLLPYTHSYPHTVVVPLAHSTGSSQSWQRTCFLYRFDKKNDRNIFRNFPHWPVSCPSHMESLNLSRSPLPSDNTRKSLLSLAPTSYSRYCPYLDLWLEATTFLSDLSPIIGNACHSLTHWLTNSLTPV